MTKKQYVRKGIRSISRLTSRLRGVCKGIHVSVSVSVFDPLPALTQTLDLPRILMLIFSSNSGALSSSYVRTYTFSYSGKRRRTATVNADILCAISEATLKRIEFFATFRFRFFAFHDDFSYGCSESASRMKSFLDISLDGSLRLFPGGFTDSC